MSFLVHLLHLTRNLAQHRRLGAQTLVAAAHLGFVDPDELLSVCGDWRRAAECAADVEAGLYGRMQVFVLSHAAAVAAQSAIEDAATEAVLDNEVTDQGLLQRIHEARAGLHRRLVSVLERQQQGQAAGAADQQQLTRMPSLSDGLGGSSPKWAGFSLPSPATVSSPRPPFVGCCL